MYSLGGYVAPIASVAMWSLYRLGGYWVATYDRPRRPLHGYSALAAKVLSLCCTFLAAGVFTSGAWPLLSNLEDPELRRLAQALPATVLRSSSSRQYHKEVPWSILSSKTDQYREGSSLVKLTQGS